MDLVKKIWSASAVLFLTMGITALGHTAWIVCAVMAILLGGVFVVRGFLPNRNIGALFVGDRPGLAAAFFLMVPLWILHENTPHGCVPFFLLMSAASVFCVLMTVRPGTRDFGVHYGLCNLSVFFTVEEFGKGWTTWLVISLCALMIIVRLIKSE